MFPVSDVIPSRTTPFVTVGLIALNALVFLHQLTLSDRQLQVFVENYGVVPAYFSWMTVLTSMFLHGGWLHFAGNMLYLWIFGDNVEDRFGHFRFVIFYFICGIVAGLTHILLNGSSTIPSVGASGAIAGVLAAYLRLFPHAQVRTLLLIGPFILVPRIAATFLIIFWFATQFLAGVMSLGAQTEQSSGVAVWAHVGGFVCGLVLTELFRPRRRQASFSY